MSEKLITIEQFYKQQYYTAVGTVFGLLIIMYTVLDNPDPKYTAIVLGFVKVYAVLMLVFILSTNVLARFIKNNPPPENIDE